jgi:hypothetical protein
VVKNGYGFRESITFLSSRKSHAVKLAVNFSLPQKVTISQQREDKREIKIAQMTPPEHLHTLHADTS